MHADGYKYWLAYKKGNLCYYRCSRYKTKCPGRCVVDGNGAARNTTAHNHPPEAERVIVDRFRKVLTQRAASESTDLHVIYLEEASNRHADAALLYSFAQAESCMRKARRKMHPPGPCSMTELKEILESTDWFQIHCGANWDQFYQTTVSSIDSTSLVLWHKRTVDAVGKIDYLYLDCSLQNSTGGSSKYHLLVWLTIYRNHCVPIIYCIMTERSLAGYIAIFAYVKDRLGPQVIPATIATEPDRIIQSAVEICFPEVTVTVYWHHYTTAVLERMRHIGMYGQTSKGHASSALKMLLVLPLLPGSSMNDGLEALKKWIMEKEVSTECFKALCDYVQQSWLDLFEAKRLSIFEQTQGTSNLVKYFLRDLRSQSGLQRCSIWQMLETLAQMTTKNYVKLKRIIKKPKRDQPQKWKSKFQQLQENVISQATQQWNRSPVHLRNPLQFLMLSSHCINDAMVVESFPNYVFDHHTSKKSLAEALTSLANPIRPAVHLDPPPLTFFPEIEQFDRNGAVHLGFSQNEPPPLAPFTATNMEPNMQNSATVQEDPV